MKIEFQRIFYVVKIAIRENNLENRAFFYYYNMVNF